MHRKTRLGCVTQHRWLFYLLGTLLVLLNLFMIKQLSEVFYPLSVMSEIVGPPLVLATVFFYLFNPVVTWLEVKGISRGWGVLLIFLVMVGFVAVSILYIFPIVQKQIELIIIVLPAYIEELIRLGETVIRTSEFNQIYEQMQGSNIVETLTQQGTNVLNATVNGLGSIVNVLAQAVFVLLTVPFILYFLLVSPEKIPQQVLYITPVKWRNTISTFLSEVHRQLSIYVRGQLMVAFFVGTAFLIGFAIIGLDFYIVLAIIGGVLNLVPYLGSIIAALLALVIGFFQAPIMVVYVLVVIMLESLIENRIIQPFILGNQLNIHPITILFIMLIAGNLMGIMGLLLGIPIYAILKIIVQMLFDYIKRETTLYKSVSSDTVQSELDNQ